MTTLNELTTLTTFLTTRPGYWYDTEDDCWRLTPPRGGEIVIVRQSSEVAVHWGSGGDSMPLFDDWLDLDRMGEILALAEAEITWD